jgi:YVTN family beta-propeller protein
MKNVPRLILAASACASALLLGGCPWDQPQSPSLGGFFVFTEDDNGFFKVPHPGAFVNGSWRQDLPGTVHGQELNFDGTTDSNGVYHVLDGRIPAVWDVGVIWNVPCGNTAAAATVNVTPENPNVEWVCAPAITPASPQFSIFGQSPSTITIGSSGLSSAYGLPQLNVYDSTPKLVSQSFATSVSPDGAAATFVFPKITSSGASLPSGVYGFNLWNKNSSGTYLDQGVNFLSVGTNDTSKATPYGVDGADVTTWTWWCTPGTRGQRCAGSSSSSTVTAPAPILTLSSANEAIYNGHTFVTGTQPVAVKLYGSAKVWVSNTPTFMQTRTGPSQAIVANFASGSVTILNLVSNAVTTTIAVGAQPSEVTIKADATKAYVANYGSSSISEIDLGSNTQSRVASVGVQPAGLAMDPGGTALWVGGSNYISKLDLATFSVIQTFSVSGQVTSLAVSAGQNSLVYTTVATAGGSTTFQAQQAAVANAAIQGTYAHYTMSSSTPYAQAITSGGPAPGASGWLASGGALVSANYGNGLAVVGTPTGFALLDLVHRTTVMQGNTPSAVHGIATSPAQGIVYITAPDSNSFITVPLPPQN